MKKLFSLAVCCLISCTMAGAGNEVGGGGVAENNFVYALMNLDGVLALCLGSDSCGLTDRDRALLGKIRSSLPQEPPAKEALVFRSASASPGFFDIDGPDRIARTEYRVGSTIFINRDLLYPAAPAAIPIVSPVDRPFDIPNAVAILVHELGHHQGEPDHAYLDQLGSKVQTLLRAMAQEQDGGPENRSLIVTVFSLAGNSTIDLVVRNGAEMASYGKRVAELIECDRNAVSPGTGYALWNLHWKRTQDLGGGVQKRPLRARVYRQCGPAAQAVPKEEEVEIDLYFNTSGGFEFLKNKTEIKPIDCGANPLLCD